MNNKVAVLLFDYTGIMATPWANAGYTCYCFDGQHPEGITEGSHPNIKNVGMWFSKEVSKAASLENVENICKVVGDKVEFIFGFPECTDLAVSGARHFEKKRESNPLFQEEALQLVYLVEELGKKLNCPWGLENPVSVISTKWRKPDFIFQPYEFGGYLPKNDVHPLYPEYIKPRDAYKKRTCIWCGNGFIEPEKATVPVASGNSVQYKKLGGKSLKTKNIRSATPKGFAKAVFEANKS